MADALVPVVLEQLTSIVTTKLSGELKLLKGVEKEIRELITDLETITVVLDDAEKRRVKETAVEIWVDELKQVCYDMEDVLDEWRTATIQKQPLQPAKHASSLIKKVISWISSHLPWIRRPVWKHNIALKIKDINQRVDKIANQKDKYNFNKSTATVAMEHERPKTTSFFDASRIHGRDHVKEILIGRLLRESKEEHNLSTTAIVGMGGIGKTTLAQLAFNHENVKRQFEKRIWVCVSDPFNVTDIAKAIIEALGIKDRNLIELENMFQKISEAIENQKFLLVLDDVWNEDKERWEQLRNPLINGAQGSKILVTTRNKGVASIMEATNPIHLEELSIEECWSIFSQIAFFGRSEEERKVLEDTGRKISERCKGLPLAAKVLGGLMCSKRSRLEWQNVLESDLWKLEEANKYLNSVFMLSYYDMPLPLKRCFTYCGVFPEDLEIDTNQLNQLWMANGFLKGGEMEITGEEYIESLAMRSLFQDLKRDASGRIVKCKMHDLVREFAVRLSRNECGAIEVYKDEEELMVKQEPGYAKLRHATLTFNGRDHSSSLALSKFSISGLRTLMSTDLLGPNAAMKVLGGLFCGLTRLRALELRYSDIKELPLEIGKLMHLRYLGLESNYELKALPETLCDLFNLQTLKLNGCSEVKRLPRGIGKLLNLRHLEFEHTGIKKLPKGIGELTSLRTLQEVKFSNDNREEEEEYFGIGDFEKLNCLRGNLFLHQLGDLELSDVGEATRARLKNKKNLQKLHLDFSWSSSRDAAAEEENEREKRHLLIAKALEPPPYLENLEFDNYEGTELPSWITSLSGLKHLALNYCFNLKELPETVCDLCNLQTLKLDCCSSIKRLPRGIGKLLNLRHLECDLSMKLPKGIGELTSLRKLSGRLDCSNNNREDEEYFGIGDLEKFNCLEFLRLYGLGNVKLLDSVIGEAKRARFKNKKNLRGLDLDFKESWKLNAAKEAEEEKAKRHLLIAEALLEEEAPPPHLERLEFISYRGTELPSWIASLPGLKFLHLRSCPNLKELPGDFFERLPLLHRVGIRRCPTLAEHCRRRMNGNRALAFLFRIY